MSAVSTTITIDLTEAQAAILKADAALSGGMADNLNTAADSVTHRHLRAEYVNKPNRLNATSTGYWDRVDKSVLANTEKKGDNFTTTVSLSGVGLWMKYNGGTIRPTGRISTITGKPIKYLTIPVIAEAHGKTASEFPFLKLNGGALAKMEPGSKFGTAYFILAKQAVIKPDPNIIPPADAVITEMTAAIKAALE